MGARFPVPPGVVGRVVQTAADPEASVADLARLIGKDAVLSAQVLRTVNSALFGLRHRVASVERAVGLMGMRAVRNLVLSLGVRDLVPTSSVGEFPLDRFWECCLRRAAAARCLAERLELADVEEFFTLGLCQDIGVLVRLREDETYAARMAAAFDRSSDERLALEQDASDHARTGFAIFSEWRFPDELTLPIRYHHRPEEAPEPQRLRARVAHAAEAVADLFLVADKQAVLSATERRLDLLGLDREALEAVVARVNELVGEFAELLGLTVADPPSFEQIITTASRGLASLNLSYEEMTKRLEQALEEQRRMAAQLEQLNHKLEAQVRTDPLTGLANRRLFDEALAREMSVARRQGVPLSLAILDIDCFKAINDTHGHAAGDRVLERIGGLLAERARSTDVVARYGGEEFVLLFPFTDRAGALIAAERHRQAVARLEIPWKGRTLRVTASLGGVTLSPVNRCDARACEALLDEADRALYRSKREGRNRVSWSAIDDGAAFDAEQLRAATDRPVPAGRSD